MVVPIPVPLPELPSSDFWSETQWEVLFALMDAVLPPIVPASDLEDEHAEIRISDDELAEAYQLLKKIVASPPREEEFRAYLRLSPLADPNFVDGIKRSMSTVAQEAQKKLGGVLGLLSLVICFHTPLPLRSHPIPGDRNHANIVS
jgi:hypothetical protein